MIDNAIPSDLVPSHTADGMAWPDLHAGAPTSGIGIGIVRRAKLLRLCGVVLSIAGGLFFVFDVALAYSFWNDDVVSLAASELADLKVYVGAYWNAIEGQVSQLHDLRNLLLAPFSAITQVISNLGR